MSAIYYGELITKNGGSAKAFTYANGTVTPTDSRVTMETGTGYWALKIDGDYSMVYDVDGLSVGDLELPTTEDFPRLDFYQYTAGIKQKMASLTKSGRLEAQNVIETDTLPTSGGMSLFGNVVITPQGIYSDAVNEVWFLTDNNGNYLCSDGMLIAVP